MNKNKLIIILALTTITSLLDARGSMGGGMSGGGGRSSSMGSFSGGGSRMGSGSFGGGMRTSGFGGSRSFGIPVAGRSFSGTSSYWPAWQPNVMSVPATSTTISTGRNGWQPGDEDIDSWSPGMIRKPSRQRTSQQSLIQELEGAVPGQTTLQGLVNTSVLSSPKIDAAAGMNPRQLQQLIEKTVQKTVKAMQKQQAMRQEKKPKVYAEQMDTTPADEPKDETTPKYDPALRQKLNKAVTKVMKNPRTRNKFLRGFKDPKFAKSFAKLAQDDQDWLAHEMEQAVKDEEAEDLKFSKELLQMLIQAGSQR